MFKKISKMSTNCEMEGVEAVEHGCMTHATVLAVEHDHVATVCTTTQTVHCDHVVTQHVAGAVTNDTQAVHSTTVHSTTVHNTNDGFEENPAAMFVRRPTTATTNYALSVQSYQSTANTQRLNAPDATASYKPDCFKLVSHRSDRSWHDESVDGGHPTQCVSSTDNSENVWSSLMQYMREKHGEFAYNNWLSNLKFCGIKDGVLCISAHTKFVRELVIKNYLESMLRHISQTMGGAVRIIDVQADCHMHSNIAASLRTATDEPATQENDNISCMRSGNRKTTYKITKGYSPIGCSTVSHAIAVESLALNISFTFESFVRNKSNRVACNAAKSLAERMCGKVDNIAVVGTDFSTGAACASTRAFRSLYIHGSVGVGKTHLLQAVASYIMKCSTKLNVAYFTAERFTQYYVSSVRRNELTEFKNVLRNLDMLVMDDLQIICGRSGTEREFTNILDEVLESSNKMILLAADSPPYSLHFNQRTKSRLAGCMVVGMDKADYEMRIAILQHKAKERKVSISTELISLIAERVSTDVREAEAMLCKVVTHCDLLNIPIDESIVRKLLDEYTNCTQKSNEEHISRNKGALLPGLTTGASGAKKQRTYVRSLSRQSYTNSSSIRRPGMCSMSQNILKLGYDNVKAGRDAYNLQDLPLAHSRDTGNTGSDVNIEDSSCVTLVDDHSVHAAQDTVIDEGQSTSAMCSKVSSNEVRDQNTDNDAILNAVCAEFGITIADIQSSKRDAKTLIARQITALLLHKSGSLTLRAIGMKLGGRSHSTVLHLIKMAHKTIDSDRTGRLHHILCQVERASTDISEH